MRLLFLTPQLPHPPRQGTAIRNWGLVSRLAARHEITLLSFAEVDHAALSPELRAACVEVITRPTPTRTRADRLRTLASAQPDLARRLWSPQFAQALWEVMTRRPFDLIQIEGLELAPYLWMAHKAAPRVRALYDAHNVEHLLQRRAFLTDLRQPRRWLAALYSWLQTPRLRRFEAAACGAAQAVTCVSPDDARALQTLVPTLQPAVIPNGIALADYALRPPRPAEFNDETVVFTGKMDYRPNMDAVLWFAAEAWPRIRGARPQAQFAVVGQQPPAAITALHGQHGIIVTGAVADTRPYLAHAAVYVAPLRMGGGTRFKLLEAMAFARPIVSTTLGAEGFPVQQGRELLLADTPSALAEAVLSIFAAPNTTLGAAGRRFVAAYDWAQIAPRLEEVYTGWPPRP